MRMVYAKIIICFFILIGHARATGVAEINAVLGTDESKTESPWFERHEEGWWYKKEERLKKPKERENNEVPINSLYPSLMEQVSNPIERLEKLQQELEKAQALAVLQPTPTNIERFHKINHLIQNKSEYFADAWRRLVWQNPQLDPGIHRPSSGQGTFAWATNYNKTKEEHLSALADSHALVYFFEHECPYCTAQSPIVKMFAKRHGLYVRALSRDGTPTPHWPNAEYSATLNQEFNIEYVPALFLVQPSTGSIVPISYGLVSLDEIENRIYALTKLPTGQMTYSPYKATRNE